MQVRCADCGRRVDLGDATVERAYFPMWDHLFDHHPGLIFDGTFHRVMFTTKSGQRLSLTQVP